MSEYINKVTFIRNIIVSCIFGLLVPYLIYRYLDPNSKLFNYQMGIANGIIYVIIYSLYGLFRKETVARFLIGVALIIAVIYFYTVGYTIYTFYMPHCGFGILCLSGTIPANDIIPTYLQGIVLSLSYNYMYTALIVIGLKSVNLFRHLVKPPDAESNLKIAALKKVGFRRE